MLSGKVVSDQRVMALFRRVQHHNFTLPRYTTTPLIQPNFHGPTVVVLTEFHCTFYVYHRATIEAKSIPLPSIKSTRGIFGGKALNREGVYQIDRQLTYKTLYRTPFYIFNFRPDIFGLLTMAGRGDSTSIKCQNEQILQCCLQKLEKLLLKRRITSENSKLFG